jgi:hypothetical protein
MKIRYQADNDVAPALVYGVQQRNSAIDFQTAQVAQLDGVLDPEVLAKASTDGRLLVTHDRSTMPQHFADFVSNNNFCPGVFLIAQDFPMGRAIEELVLIWETSEAEEWYGSIVHVPF